MNKKQFPNKFLNLFKNIISPNPNYLILYVTSRCNARCATCFNWKRIEDCNLRKELNIEEIYKIAKNFSNLEYLNLTGGEPFLRKDLKKIIYIFVKMTKLSIVTIPTNGSMTDNILLQMKWILKKCPNIKFNINLSIDGIGEDHNKIRGFDNLFNKVIKTYDGLIGLQKIYPNLRIQTSTVLSKFNEEKIDDILFWIKTNLKIQNPTIDLIRGNPKDPQSLVVDLLNYIQLIKNTKPELSKQIKYDNDIFNNLLRSVKILSWDFIANISILKKNTVRCYSGSKMLVIDDVSNVYPCEILNQSFGNLRENNFDLNLILRKKENINICKKIKNFSYNTCQNCTWECSTQNNLVNNPKYYHLIVKDLIKRKLFNFEI